MTKPSLYGPRAWIEGPWPYRPAPQDDELASSFLARTAQGLGLMPITFLNALFGSSRSLLNQDLDAYMPAPIVTCIAEGSGLDPVRITAMTLADMVGHLNLSHIPRARKTWILPTAIASNDRRRAGLQYCPKCIAEDEHPYLRRNWRVGFVTLCTRHRVRLLDRCPHCEAFIHIHRSPSLRHCYRCVGSLSVATAARPVGEEACARQRANERILTDGYAVFGGRPVYSPLFFIVLRRVAGLIVNGKRADEVRAAIVSRFGGDGAEFAREHQRHPLEYLRTADRDRMLDLAGRALDQYPERLLSICHDAGLKRSHVVKDMAYVPFVLDEILKARLDDEPYKASEEEVAAAAAWLRRKRGRATYRDLKAHCGESRSAIYRHMDYERRPAKPSWRRSSAEA